MVIEERVTATIEKFVWHREYIERSRLNFAAKIQLARAISMDHHQNTMWDLIAKLNAVRDKLAHSLDGEPRKNAMAALRAAYAREVSKAAKEELENDTLLLGGVLSLCLGWVHAFELEVARFRHYVDVMDRVLTPHRHEPEEA